MNKDMCVQNNAQNVCMNKDQYVLNNTHKLCTNKDLWVQINTTHKLRMHMNLCVQTNTTHKLPMNKGPAWSERCNAQVAHEQGPLSPEKYSKQGAHMKNYSKYLATVATKENIPQCSPYSAYMDKGSCTIISMDLIGHLKWRTRSPMEKWVQLEEGLCVHITIFHRSCAYERNFMLYLRKRTAVCPNRSDEEYRKFVTTVNMTTTHQDLYVKSPEWMSPECANHDVHVQKYIVAWVAPSSTRRGMPQFVTTDMNSKSDEEFRSH
jgi:hypothetical protein